VNRDVKVILATAILGTVFALVMYYSGATEEIMRLL